MVTADAMHTQRTHASLPTSYLVEERGADYVLIVKAPNLFAQLDSLDRSTTPLHTTDNTGHGRAERRTIRVRPAPEDIDFPHAAQVFLIERYVTDTKTGKNSAIAVLGITSRESAVRCGGSSTSGESFTARPWRVSRFRRVRSGPAATGPGAGRRGVGWPG
jgi:hypothetical protein